MFSDNENPGVETSAGQSASAATPAPETITPTVQTEETLPAAAEAQDPSVSAPVVAEPAAVTVSPTEPVAAPDGAAAVEHSDMSAAAESGEPSTESTAEMEQLMEQYAAPHQAPSEGEIESGQVVAVIELGVVVDLGGKTEGLIPAQEFAELDGWTTSRAGLWWTSAYGHFCLRRRRTRIRCATWSSGRIGNSQFAC